MIHLKTLKTVKIDIAEGIVKKESTYAKWSCSHIQWKQRKDNSRREPLRNFNVQEFNPKWPMSRGWGGGASQV